MELAEKYEDPDTFAEAANLFIKANKSAELLIHIEPTPLKWFLFSVD